MNSNKNGLFRNSLFYIVIFLLVMGVFFTSLVAVITTILSRKKFNPANLLRI